MASPAVGLRVSLGMALVALVIVALAENARIPVDNPATHLELTMVHEAMVLEYSGRHLAMIEMAAALKLLLYIVADRLRVPALGHRRQRTPGSAPMLVGARGLSWSSWRLARVLLAVFETSIAKMRVFRVPDFLGVALMLCAAGHAAAVRVAEPVMDRHRLRRRASSGRRACCWSAS